MKIEGKYELLALHRCLFEAKFNASPNDYDIAGSPIAAKLANDTVDELNKFDDQNWNDWRIAENHMERITHLIESLKKQNLKHINQASQIQFVINALAPLQATEQTIEKIITEVFNEPNI